jgi:hypothetical protein
MSAMRTWEGDVMAVQQSGRKRQMRTRWMAKTRILEPVHVAEQFADHALVDTRQVREEVGTGALMQDTRGVS